MLESALLENFSKSINPISVRTMQLLLGDESLQFCFVNSKTKPTPVVHQVTYNASTKVLSAQSGILQHLTLGINSLSSSHKADEYKYWDMSAFTSPALTESSKGYYLYAKVNKDNGAGIFYLSDIAIEMEEIAGCYHLLYGILNSEYNNERSFAPMYGFAELTPGRLTVPLIVSPDGGTYFDVANGEIGGKITFNAGSSGLENLSEWKNKQTQIDNLDRAVSGLSTYIDNAFKDGIISTSEAQAIATYVKQIDETEISINNMYESIYNNILLTGLEKSNLATAKTNVSNAINSLRTSINTAISDGKTTIEEKKDVDAKFVSFNTAYGIYMTKIEDATKFIQAKNIGYDDYAEMVANAKEKKTIISGGFINTELINTKKLIAENIVTKIKSVNDKRHIEITSDSNAMIMYDENNKPRLVVHGGKYQSVEDITNIIDIPSVPFGSASFKMQGNYPKDNGFREKNETVVLSTFAIDSNSSYTMKIPSLRISNEGYQGDPLDSKDIYIDMYMKLYKDGNYQSELYYNSVYWDWSSNPVSEILIPEISVQELNRGSYTIQIEYHMESIIYYHPQGEGYYPITVWVTTSIAPQTAGEKVQFTSLSQVTKIFSNGLASTWSNNKYFSVINRDAAGSDLVDSQGSMRFVSENGYHGIRITDNGILGANTGADTNIASNWHQMTPCIMGGGTVGGAGKMINGWGKEVVTKRVSTGIYLLTHNLNSDNYSVSVTPLNNHGGWAKVHAGTIEKNKNYVIIGIYDAGTSITTVDFEFDFMVCGQN